MQAVLGQIGLLQETEGVAMARSRADEAMERYADGDKAAFAVVYDELAPPLCRYAERWTRDKAAAEDAVHEACVHMLDAASDFVRGSPVKPWAFSITRRILIDRSRRRRWSRDEVTRVDPGPDGGEPPEPASTAPGPDEQLAWHQRRLLFEECLARLPRAHREAFVLVKKEGFSLSEAAEVLDISPINVKVRISRAKAALVRAVKLREEAKPAEDTDGRAGPIRGADPGPKPAPRAARAPGEDDDEDGDGLDPIVE